MANTKKVLALGALALMLSTWSTGLVALAADTTLPSDVENLEAFPGDGQVTLSWDPATDDTGVTGYLVYYGLTSVSIDGGSYTFGAEDAGDTTSYTLENLSNGVTYYFAVTAYDAAGNESEFYSTEVEATPEGSEVGDFTEPTVSDASAITSTLVEVTFSEPVLLPEDGATAFSIEATDGTPLEVLDATLSEETEVVFVVTEEQEAGTDYILTAALSITDLNGNPVVSGTSDTAVFTGSGIIAEPADTDVDVAPLEDTPSDTFVLDEIEATEINELLLTFSQNVMEAAPEAFTIELLEDATQTVEVLAVSIDSEDPTEVTLVTTDMEAGFDYLLSMDETILNEDGESLAVDERSMEFTALTLELADVIAPEDVTDFLASISGETAALLTWTASEDTAGDLANYLIYQSTDGVNFDDAIEVAKTLTEYKAEDLTPGETYTFKVTAVDESGNESEGVLTTITLPETGPELLVLGGLSLLGAGLATRRRRS